MRSYSEITCAPSSSRVAAISRLSSTTMAVVSEPYTTLTCDSVPKYQTSTWRVISHSSAAVAPPISAWRQRQLADRHHHVDRGQHEDLAGQPEQVKQQARDAAERPVAAQHVRRSPRPWPAARRRPA